MADTLETKRLDTAEQFEQATGLKTAPEVWKPINTTSAKLAELREQTSSLPESERQARTRAFIEANKASEAPSGVPAQVVAVAATAGIGAEIGSVIKDAGREAVAELQKPGFWKDQAKPWIADMVGGLVDAKKEGGFMGAIAGFALGIMKRFAFFRNMLTPEQLKDLGIEATSGSGGGTGDKQQPDAGTKPPVKPREQLESIPRNIVAEHTSSYFFRKAQSREYSGLWTAVWEGIKDSTIKRDEANARKDIENEGKRILGYTEVGKLTFRQIVAEKDNTQIATKLGLTGLTPEVQIPALQLTAKVLSVNEKGIDKMLGKTVYREWRDMPISQFLSHYYQYTGMATLGQVTDAISKIDIKDPGAYADAIRSVALSRGADGAIGGYVGDKLRSYEHQGINQEVVTRLVFGNLGEQPVKQFRAALSGVNKFSDPDAQAKMTELSKENGFGSSVVKLMNDIGLGSYTASLDNGESLQMEELLMAYVITGGVDNIDTLTQGQRNELIPVLYTIAARTSPGAFAAGQAVSLVDGMSQDKYVQQMSDFVGEAISDAAYVATFRGIGFTTDSVNQIMALRTDPDPEKQKKFWLIVGILGIGIGSMIYFRKPVLSVALMYGLIKMVSGIAVVSSVAK